MNSYRVGLPIFLAIVLLDGHSLSAQTEEFQGTVWILKRPNFAYVNGRCIVRGTFEDRQRPLYQQGNNLRGGTGQNVSQMTIQGAIIQGESFIVSDSSEVVGAIANNSEIGTITDVFNGTLKSEQQFEGTVNTTYYRDGKQICSLSGSFTLTRVSGSFTPTPQNAASNLAQIDRPTFETRFRAAPNEEAVALVEQQQTTATAQYLGLEAPPKITVTEVSQRLYQLWQKTDNKPVLTYIVILKDRLDLLLVLPTENPPFKVQNPLQVALNPLKFLGSLVNNSFSPVRRITLQTTQKDIQKVAQAFRQEITKPGKITTTDYLTSAQKLYQWLIAPIEPELEANKIQTIIISADNQLRLIPLAALHDGKQFLIEKYGIALIPSFGLTDTGYSDLRRATLLAMGIAKSTEEQKPLPAAAVEVSALAQSLWIEGGKGFLDEDFTLNKLKSLTQQQHYGIIHLATHAEFQQGEPDKSYIQFWGEKLRLKQLRQFTTESGWSKSPTVEMLVLSACRTAFGDEQAELGFAGLAFQAGVKTVIGSLWYVSDTGSLALMTEFYSQLKTAPTRSEALRQAQIAMLQGKVSIEAGQLKLSDHRIVPLPPELAINKIKLSHPYFWSAYTLIGNWN